MVMNNTASRTEQGFQALEKEMCRLRNGTLRLSDTKQGKNTCREECEGNVTPILFTGLLLHLQNCATPRLKMANMLSLLIQENLHSFQSEFSLCEGSGRSTDARRGANKGCYLLDTARHYQLWGKLGHASNEPNFVLMQHDHIFGKLNLN